MRAIPARAGGPPTPGLRRAKLGLHPRARGGEPDATWAAARWAAAGSSRGRADLGRLRWASHMGSSPRGQGGPQRLPHVQATARLIPRAGGPGATRGPGPAPGWGSSPRAGRTHQDVPGGDAGAHPRAGRAGCQARGAIAVGLPARARGGPQVCTRSHRVGLIPARAGRTWMIPVVDVRVEGSSPRGQGGRDTPHRLSHWMGSSRTWAGRTSAVYGDAAAAGSSPGQGRSATVARAWSVWAHPRGAGRTQGNCCPTLGRRGAHPRAGRAGPQLWCPPGGERAPPARAGADFGSFPALGPRGSSPARGQGRTPGMFTTNLRAGLCPARAGGLGRDAGAVPDHGLIPRRRGGT